MENIRYPFNTDISLTLSKNCVITDERTQDADPNADPPVPEIRVPTGAIFEIKDTVCASSRFINWGW